MYAVKHRKKRLCVGAGILLLLVLCTAVCAFCPQNAVRKSCLEQAEIFVLDKGGANAKQLSEADAQTVIDALRAVRVFGAGTHLYRFYTGSSVPMFRVIAENGAVTEFSAGSPFFIRNKKGYYIRYADAECIGKLYAELYAAYCAGAGWEDSSVQNVSENYCIF